MNAGSWHLRGEHAREGKVFLLGQGSQKRAWKRSGLPHGPPHIITIYLLESMRGGRAISSPSPVSLFSADARQVIRFLLSTGYSIAVPHVSEIARQRVSLLVSGVRAGLSGVRRVRFVSVPPFLLNLQSETFSCDRSIEIQNKMTRAVLSRALGRLV